MKKNLLMSMICAVALIASLAPAGSYDLVSLPAPGFWSPPVGGVGKVVQIDVAGSAVASGTVVLYTMSKDGLSSNLQYTATCSSGAVVAALTSTNTFYIASGDTLFRTGTATNGSCRLILE